MKKKILFVITKSNWGGAQRYVFDLATNLPKENFDVAVAFGGAGKLKEELEKAGIKTYEVPAMQRDVAFGADIKSYFALIKLFREVNPDIVHLNSSKAGGVGALAARVAGIKNIVFTSHGLAWEEDRNPLAKSLIYVITRLTFLLSHKVITISEANYKKARACLLCRKKIYLIYNGIAPMQLGSGEKIRSAFPPGVKITGTVGELTHNKNQMALIKEAQNKPDMYVAIIGEGELRKELEEKIKEYGLDARVKLFGFVPANEALKGFDTFALPSKKEGLPYVLLEAKAAGLPIVANRVGGVAEILEKDLKEFSLEKMVEKTIAVYNS